MCLVNQPFRLGSRQVLSYSIHMRGGFLVPQMGFKLSVARFLTPSAMDSASPGAEVRIRRVGRLAELARGPISYLALSLPVHTPLLGG